MRAKDGLPVWVWVAGPAAILLVAVVLLALLGEERTDTETAGDVVTYEDVAENPQRFYGETVTVSGWVETVLGPRSLLTSRGSVAGDLLVVSDAPLRETIGANGEAGEDVALKHTTVWVTGEVRRFDLAGAEREVGANLEDDALGAYVGTPAIIADSVSPERPAAAGEKRQTEGAAEGGG